MQKQNDLKVKTKITPKVRGMPKKEGKNEKERRSTFSTFSWSKRCVALFLALLSIFTMITPAFAWEVVGESGGGGSTHSVSSGMRVPNGYSYNGKITKLVGLRFSVYMQKEQVMQSKRIDVYTGGHSLGMQKCTPKFSKKQLKDKFKEGNRTLLKGTFASTDTFAANSVACGSAIPENPADVKGWASDSNNLTKILKQLGYRRGADDLNSNLLLFIEPIFPYKLNNNSLIAMTATEAVYVFWQEYNTDKSPSNCGKKNKWYNVGHYTNRYVPSCMYVGDAKAARISEVLGNGSELKSDAFISTIINNAYGLHVCVPNDSPEVKSKKVTLYTAYGFTDEDKKADGKMDYKIQSNLTKSVTVNQGQTVGYTFSKPADTITHNNKKYALSYWGFMVSKGGKTWTERWSADNFYYGITYDYDWVELMICYVPITNKIPMYTSFAFTDEDVGPDGLKQYKKQDNLTDYVTVTQGGSAIGYTFKAPDDTIIHNGKKYKLSYDGFRQSYNNKITERWDNNRWFNIDSNHNWVEHLICYERDYEVFFHANGGKIDPSSQYSVADNGIIKENGQIYKQLWPEKNPEKNMPLTKTNDFGLYREGYKFVGWSSDIQDPDDFGKDGQPDNYTPFESIPFDKAFKHEGRIEAGYADLFAVWAPINIGYNANLNNSEIPTNYFPVVSTPEYSFEQNTNLFKIRNGEITTEKNIISNNFTVQSDKAFNEAYLTLVYRGGYYSNGNPTLTNINNDTHFSALLPYNHFPIITTKIKFPTSATIQNISLEMYCNVATTFSENYCFEAYLTTIPLTLDFDDNITEFDYNSFFENNSAVKQMLKTNNILEIDPNFNSTWGTSQVTYNSQTNSIAIGTGNAPAGSCILNASLKNKGLKPGDTIYVTALGKKGWYNNVCDETSFVVDLEDGENNNIIPRTFCDTLLPSACNRFMISKLTIPEDYTEDNFKIWIWNGKNAYFSDLEFEIYITKENPLKSKSINVPTNYYTSSNGKFLIKNNLLNLPSCGVLRNYGTNKIENTFATNYTDNTITFMNNTCNKGVLKGDLFIPDVKPNDKIYVTLVYKKGKYETTGNVVLPLDINISSKRCWTDTPLPTAENPVVQRYLTIPGNYTNEDFKLWFWSEKPVTFSGYYEIEAYITKEQLDVNQIAEYKYNHNTNLMTLNGIGNKASFGSVNDVFTNRFRDDVYVALVYKGGEYIDKPNNQTYFTASFHHKAGNEMYRKGREPYMAQLALPTADNPIVTARIPFPLYYGNSTLGPLSFGITSGSENCEFKNYQFEVFVTKGDSVENIAKSKEFSQGYLSDFVKHITTSTGMNTSYVFLPGSQNYSETNKSYDIPDTQVDLTTHGISDYKFHNTNVCVNNGDLINIYRNHIIDFHWKSTVHYYANGGTGTMNLNPEKIKKGSSYTIRQNESFKKIDQNGTACEFLGWSTDPNAELPDPKYNPGNVIVFGQNLDLYAIWGKNTYYTVTYNPNGGIAQSGGTTSFANILKGNNHTVQSNAVTKFSKTDAQGNAQAFLGWDTNPNATTPTYKVDQSIPVNQNITLYAIWGKNTYYTVTYNPNGGTAQSGGTTSFANILKGNNHTVQSNAVTKFSKTDTQGNAQAFLGWDTNQNATNPTYKVGQVIAVNSNVTLYAIWGKNTYYTVTYNPNGGQSNGKPTSFNNILSGNSHTIQNSMFTWPANEFIGWDESPTATTPTYKAGQNIQVNRNITLYAIWQAKVTYNSNGGTGSMPVDSVVHGINAVDYTTKQNTFTKTDEHGNTQTFLGWDTDPKATVPKYQAGGSIPVKQNVTLYAVWGNNTYFKVTYIRNYDDKDTTQQVDQYVLKGSEYTVKSNMFPQKQGFRFNNWNVKQDGSGISYQTNNTFTITGDITLYAQWKAYVRYLGNGGLKNTNPPGAYLDPKNPYNQNQSVITILSNKTTGFVWDGNTFDHWSTNAQDTGVSYNEGSLVDLSQSPFAPNGNRNFFAIWKANVTYNANGGVGSMPIDSVLHGKNEVNYTIKQNEFTRPNWNFLGWNTNADGSGTTYQAGDIIPVKENVTLYAQWKPVYKVKYEPNGGIQNNGTTLFENILEGTTHTVQSNDVTKFSKTDIQGTNQKFLGWDENPNAAVPTYQAGQIITVNKNVTLYAIWEENEYRSVTYHANGGQSNGKESSFNNILKGTSHTIQNSMFTWNGNEFVGWTTDSTSTVPVYAYDSVAKTFKDKTGKTVSSFAVNNNVHLYAIWKAKVTYNANGGTGTMPVDSVLHTSNATEYTVKQNVFSKANWKFVGWNTNANGSGTAYNEKDSLLVKGNITLYAQWKPLYTVTYDPNGGIENGGTTLFQSILEGTSHDVKSNETVTQFNKFDEHRNPQKFLGWSKDKNAIVPDYKYDSVTKTFNPSSFVVNCDTTLYAVWEKNTYYTVTYKPNGGQPNRNYPYDNILKGTSHTIQNSMFTWTENEFIGWDESQTATTPTYKAGQSIQVNRNITLYAIWQAKVTYNANGGTGTMPVDSVPHGANAVNYTTKNNAFAKKDGLGNPQRFLGWDTDPKATVPTYKAGQTIQLNKNTTLYAVWEKNTYFAVNYKPNGGQPNGKPTSFNNILKGKQHTIQNSMFTWNGNQFIGWSENPNATVPTYKAGQNIQVNRDITLYAIWQAKVTYNANGGTGTMPIDSVPHGANAVNYTIKNNAFAKKDEHDNVQTFLGWDANPNATVPTYQVGQTIPIKQNITLYAIWEKNTYFTVTYNPNGGKQNGGTTVFPNILKGNNHTIQSNNITRFSKLDEHGNYQKFLGWDTNPTATMPTYKAGQTIQVNKNTTLYAIWEKNTYFKVTYMRNYDNTDTESFVEEYILKDSEYTIKNNMFAEKQGWHFNLWSLNQNGSDISYQAGTTIAITEDITLYAQRICNVIYDANGGKASNGQTQVSDSKNPYNQNNKTFVALGNEDTKFTWAGNEFSHWQYKGNSQTYTKGQTVPLNGDTTLLAIWKARVTYNANGGTGNMAVDSILHGNNAVRYAVKQNAFARANWKFIGWNTKADGSGTAYNEKDIIFVKENITLYAQWKPLYTVTYNPNGGTQNGGTTLFQNILEGSNHTVQSNTVTKFNKIDEHKNAQAFLGWDENPSAKSPTYKAGQTIKVNKNTTLYAIWKENVYFTVTYNPNGGTQNGGVTLFKNILENSNHTAQANTVTKFTKIDEHGNAEKFLGWDINPVATIPTYKVGDTIPVNQNITLYAIWEKNTYFTVTYMRNYDSTDTESFVEEYLLKDSLYTVKDNMFGSRNGFQPDGWVSDTGQAYQANDTFNITRNVILYARWKDLEPIMSVEYYQPNANYVENNWVVTTFKVTNLINYDFNSDTGGLVQLHLNVYSGIHNPDVAGQTGELIATSNRSFVIPAKKSQNVYTKVRIPENSANENITFEVTMTYNGKTVYTSETKETVYRTITNITDEKLNPNHYTTKIVTEDASKMEKYGYSTIIPTGYSQKDEASVPSKNLKNAGMWDEYVYNSSTHAFEKKTYYAYLKIDQGSTKPNANAPVWWKDTERNAAKGVDNKYNLIRSGYALDSFIATSFATSPKLEAMGAIQSRSRIAVQIPQTANFFYPENNYGEIDIPNEFFLKKMNGGQYTSTNLKFVKANQTANTWFDTTNVNRNRIAQVACFYDLNHFTPMWAKDGDYIVQAVATNAWTPAGMISAENTIDNTRIKGSIYSDWRWVSGYAK